MAKYIDEKEFSDFKENFKTLVDTFNHSVTDIKNDVKEFKTKTEDNMDTMGKDVAEMKGSLKTSNKLLWILISTIITIIAAAALSTIG